ncbi:hypothetical protein JCM9157_3555 [Halalkalibacter akibai JCM 9157]|uniref:ABC3 transporter permease C-terminal domain-containing protein n=1 Tax=Halalkalibacter akibai (strain ATCC 43226 / DSM 21942 / CIP 109018 / JCM 9157 / 1139) TaxID=1236973 RepID=W4QXL2_HALA3|nr:hypothetical protein JCM9157_3555 [Halalkalibacter akibai JCM 9157]
MVAIFKVILRKMINNRWLTGSLFLGLIITVSLVSSIPTYTSSIMQKLLINEFEDHQRKNNQFPGEFYFTDNFSKDVVPSPKEALSEVEQINENLTHKTGLPILTSTQVVFTSPLKIEFEQEDRNTTSQRPARMLMMTGIFEHITLTDGKLPSPTLVDGVFEAIVPESALLEREMVLNTVFKAGENEKSFFIKPVGTFKLKDEQDPYWTMNPDLFNRDFIIREELFRGELLESHDEVIGLARFSTSFDYHAVNNEHISTLLQLEDQIKVEIGKVKNGTIMFHFPIKDILKRYETKGNQLTVMLWSLNVPILVMLAIYLFMVSRLIISRQLNEIAIFASRGAKRSQILWIYFIEIAILGFLAFLIGPYLGLLLCQLLGSANGFLEFVDRSSLPITLMPKSYLYAFLAVLAAIVMVMIPVFQASRQSIVSHKQKMANRKDKFNWYTILIDIGLLAISLYGLTTFYRRQEQLFSMGGNYNELYIDPLLFFIPALFIIGFGLFILRIYPFCLQAIYKLGEKIWSLSLYSTFLQVSRSTKQYQFLMLFLIMTIAIGVFSASAARTINSNLEEQLRYRNGAEVTVDVLWQSRRVSLPALASATEESTDVTPVLNLAEVSYTEPAFEPFMNLAGVESVTKVFKKQNVTAISEGVTRQSIEFMAIEPKAFGETAWFKSSLLLHHWYEYLNLLAKEPSAVLISDTVASSLGVETGDYLTVQWDGSSTGEFVVYGVIEYWPTFNPINRDNEGADPALLVANLPYVQNMMGLEPYQVWMKVKPEVTRSSIYDEIKELKLPITQLSDVQPKIVELKNSALLLGINGTMTLGFLISILITFIGFLLYWVITIKSRTLEYGIYRAMGMPMPKLVSMMVWEQILTSGMACLLGIVIGGVTSRLFVPLFKLSLNPTEMVPPFSVVFDPQDELKIYLFVLFMLTVGLVVLVMFLKKVKIHQAIKLGED